MVNYVYAPDRNEANHEAFVRGTVVRSAEVAALMEAPRPQPVPKRALLPSLGMRRGD